LEAHQAIYVPAPPIILSLFPKGVSMASKAMEPTTTKDILLGLISAAKLGDLSLKPFTERPILL
jgi:hypothetical protein